MNIVLQLWNATGILNKWSFKNYVDLRHVNLHTYEYFLDHKN